MRPTQWATRLFADLADMTIAAGKAAGLDHYNIVSVNNSMSAEWGQPVRGLRLRQKARQRDGERKRCFDRRG